MTDEAVSAPEKQAEDEWERHADDSVKRFLLDRANPPHRESGGTVSYSYLTDALAIEREEEDGDGLFWFGSVADGLQHVVAATPAPSRGITKPPSRFNSPAPTAVSPAEVAAEELIAAATTVAAAAAAQQLHDAAAAAAAAAVAELELENTSLLREGEAAGATAGGAAPPAAARDGRSQLEAMLGISRPPTVNYRAARQVLFETHHHERRPAHTGGPAAPTKNWAPSPQRAAVDQLVEDGVLLPVRNAKAFALTRADGLPKAQLHQVSLTGPPLSSFVAAPAAPTTPSRLRTRGVSSKSVTAALKSPQLLPPLSSSKKGNIALTALPLLRPKKEDAMSVTPAAKRKALIEERTKSIAAMNRHVHMLKEADQWTPPSQHLEGQPETSSLQWTFSDPSKQDVLQRRACAVAAIAARELVKKNNMSTLSSEPLASVSEASGALVRLSRFGIGGKTTSSTDSQQALENSTLKRRRALEMLRRESSADQRYLEPLTNQYRLPAYRPDLAAAAVTVSQKRAFLRRLFEARGQSRQSRLLLQQGAPTFGNLSSMFSVFDKGPTGFGGDDSSSSEDGGGSSRKRGNKKRSRSKRQKKRKKRNQARDQAMRDDVSKLRKELMEELHFYFWTRKVALRVGIRWHYRFLRDRTRRRLAEAKEECARVKNLADMMVEDRETARYERHVARVGVGGSIRGWRTIYVFISSTFRDMHAERNVLTQDVFPVLNERARSRRVQVVPIDLRWGLTAEQCEIVGALELCLQEINRSIPFFVALMGSRYGWRPPDYPVSDDPSFTWVKTFPAGKSITELEIQHGFLRHQVPRHAFTYMRDPTFLKDVPPDIIGAFTSDKEDTARLESLKTFMMAHPFNKMELTYPCTWDKTSDPPRLDEKDMSLFRDTCVEDLWAAIDFECPPLPDVDKEAQELAEHMKHSSRLNGWYCERADVYKEAVNGMRESARKRRPFTITAHEGGGKSALAAHIFENLPLSMPWKLTKSRGGSVHSISPVTSAPGSPAASKPSTPRGSPEGGGLAAMSAAMDVAMEQAKTSESVEEFNTADAKEEENSWWSYGHFVGCTPMSKNVRHLVMRLCSTLRRDFDLEEEVPENWGLLKRYFARALVQAGKAASAIGTTVLIVIDGLDEMAEDYDAHSLEWLPADIGNVVMLLSTSNRRSDAQCLDALVRRQPPLTVMQVPDLVGSACIDLVVYNITHYRKHLTKEQLELVAAKSDAVHPLYLRIICEELRLHGEYGYSGELVDKKINELSNTTPELVGDVLFRLEEYAEAEVGGAQMIGDAMCLIYCSGEGLLEEEILALLAPPGMSQLPRQTWMKLVMMFSDYMHIPENTAEGRFRFFHVGFRNAIKSRYLSLPEYMEQVHRALCCYFMDIADPKFDGTFESTCNVEKAQRAFKNVVYHAMRAGRLSFTALDVTLCNISFLQRICFLFPSGIFDLVHDYHRCDERFKDIRKYAQSFRQVDTAHQRNSTHDKVRRPSIASVLSFEEVAAGRGARLDFSPTIFWAWHQERSESNYKTMPLPEWYTQIIDDDVRCFTVETSASARIYSATLITRQAETDCKLADVAEDFRPSETKADTRKSMKPTKDPVAGTDSWIIKVDNGTGVDYYYNTRTQERREFIPQRLTIDDWKFLAVDFYHDEVFQRLKESDGCIPLSQVPALKRATMKHDAQILAAKAKERRLAKRAMRRRMWMKRKERHAARSESESEDDEVNDEDWTSDASIESTESVLEDELEETLGIENAQLWLKRRNARQTLVEAEQVAAFAIARVGESRSETASGEMVQHLTHLFGRRIRQFADFIRSDAAVLGEHTHLMCQRATHEPPGTAPEIVAKAHLAKGHGQATWMTWRNKPKSRHLIGVHEVPFEISCVCFGHDSKSCAYGLRDGTVHIVAVPSLSVTHQMLDLKPTAVESLSWCKKFGWLVGGNAVGEICVWSVATGLVVNRWTAHTLAVCGVMFSHNNKFLATASHDAKLSIWLTTTFEQKEKKVTLVKTVSTEGEDAIRCIAYSPNDKYIAAGSATGEIHIWDVQSPSLQVFVEREIIGHTDEITHLAFDDSGTMLLSGSLDTTTRVWGALDGTCKMDLTGDAQGISMVGFENTASTLSKSKIKSARRAFTANVNGVILVWDLKRRNVMRPLRGHKAEVTSAAFSPNNMFIISASVDKTLRLWHGEDHLNAAEEARLDNVEAQRREEGLEDLRASMQHGTYDSLNESDEGSHAGSVTALAASSTFLASGGDDFAIFLYDRTTGGMIAVQEHAHTGAVTALAFSPGSKLLFSGSEDHRLIMWSIDVDEETSHHELTQLTELEAHAWGITSIEIIELPDREPMLLTCDRTGLAVLWGQVTTGQPQLMCKLPSTSVASWTSLSAYTPPALDAMQAGLKRAAAAAIDTTEGKAYWFDVEAEEEEVVEAAADDDEEGASTDDDGPDADGAVKAAAAAAALAVVAEAEAAAAVVMTQELNLRIDEFAAMRTQIPTLRWVGMTTSGKRFSYLGAPGSEPPSVAITVVKEEDVLDPAAVEGAEDGGAEDGVVVDEAAPNVVTTEEEKVIDAAEEATAADDAAAASTDADETQEEAAPVMPAEWMMASSSMAKLSGKGLLGIDVRPDDIDVWTSSAEAQLIAGGANDGKIWLWQQLMDGSVSAPILLGAHKDAVLAISFSPCGTAMVTGGADNNVTVWDTRTGSMMGKFCTMGDCCSVLMVDRTVCVCGDDGGEVYVLHVDSINVGANMIKNALQRHYQQIWYEERTDDRQDEWTEKHDAWKDARRKRRKDVRSDIKAMQKKLRMADGRVRKKQMQLEALEARVEKAEKAMEKLRSGIAEDQALMAVLSEKVAKTEKADRVMRKKESKEKFVTEESYMWASPLPAPVLLTYVELKRWYAESFASVLHDIWRESYRQADGTIGSRVKKIGGFEFDIANLPFEDLPERYQVENLESAKVASRHFVEQTIVGNAVDDAFIEYAAANVHIAWMERNREWAPANLLMPYAELSEEEKEKDRRIVREAVSVLAHTPPLGPRVPPMKWS